MKFTTNAVDLQRALNKLGGVVPVKSTLPILENILFDLLNNTLTMTATDMEISLMISVNVKGEEDGRIAIPAKRLMDTVRALDERSLPVFQADITTNKITITTSNGQYSLTGESAKEFPAVPELKDAEEVKLSVTTLKKIVHRTAFAVSTDELRPAMMGVLVQSKGSDLRAVSTDGHRLVKVLHKFPKGAGFKRDIIIPAKALNTISKSVVSGDVSISMNDTHIMFAFENIMRAKGNIERAKNNQQSIVFTEMPYSKAVFLERIGGLKLKGVSGIRDESEGNRTRVVVNLESDADGQSILDEMHRRTQMTERAMLISRLIDETYPNYESVIPSDNDKTLKVNRDALISSIRRVSLYASATTHQVKFDVNKSNITISAQDLDFGGEAKESIELDKKAGCEYNGEKLEIGFNSTYVLDMLTHLDSDNVTFKFSLPTRAGIVSPETPNEDEDVTMLVMPVRLTS